MTRSVLISFATLALLSPIVGQKQASKIEEELDVDPVAVQKNLDILFAMPSEREVEDAMVRLTCSGETAVPGLSLLLMDPRPKLRARVYRVLEDLGKHAEGAVPALKRRMKSRDPWERVRAAQLALTFDKLCEPAMHVLADTNNMEYRCRAARALPEAEDTQAVCTSLGKLIRDFHGPVRKLAYRSVDYMGSRAAPMVPKLMAEMTGRYATKLDSEDIPGAIFSGGRRLKGADRGLFAIGEASVGPLLKQHAKGDAKVQLRVLNLLGAMGRENDQRKAIRISLTHGDAKVRDIAYRCLANLRVKDAAELPALLAAAHDHPRDPEAIPRLVDYVKTVRAAPTEVLRRAWGTATKSQKSVILRVVVVLPVADRAIAWDRFSKLLLVFARDADAAIRAGVPAVLQQRIAKFQRPRSLRALQPVALALSRGGVDVTSLRRYVEQLSKSGPSDLRVDAGRFVTALER